MPTPLESLVAAGTKLWLDSVDPTFVKDSRTYGATGATSNPVIISDLIKTGRFDRQLLELMEEGLDDENVACISIVLFPTGWSHATWFDIMGSQFRR